MNTVGIHCVRRIFWLFEFNSLLHFLVQVIDIIDDWESCDRRTFVLRFGFASAFFGSSDRQVACLWPRLCNITRSNERSIFWFQPCCQDVKQSQEHWSMLFDKSKYSIHFMDWGIVCTPFHKMRVLQKQVYPRRTQTSPWLWNPLQQGEIVPSFRGWFHSLDKIFFFNSSALRRRTKYGLLWAHM